jgi:hypothetical protein
VLKTPESLIKELAPKVGLPDDMVSDETLEKLSELYSMLSNRLNADRPLVSEIVDDWFATYANQGGSGYYHMGVKSKSFLEAMLLLMRTIAKYGYNKSDIGAITKRTIESRLIGGLTNSKKVEKAKRDHVKNIFDQVYAIAISRTWPIERVEEIDEESLQGQSIKEREIKEKEPEEVKSEIEHVPLPDIDELDRAYAMDTALIPKDLSFLEIDNE